MFNWPPSGHGDPGIKNFQQRLTNMLFLLSKSLKGSKDSSMGWKILSSLSKWAPIRLDALGIVTLIGEQVVNRSIRRLVRYRYVEYLPLLAGQVVAGNGMARPIPGFHLFNIIDKIHATDIAALFAYWLSAWEFTGNSTIIHAASNTPSLVTKSVDITISILILAAPS
jgi:hypothetical protein